MEFLNKSTEFRNDKQNKVNKVIEAIEQRETVIKGLEEQREIKKAELSIAFDSNKVNEVKELDKQIEDIENEISILNENKKNIELVKMDYSIDTLKEELNILLNDGETGDYIERIIKLKNDYINTFNEFDEYIETIGKKIGNVKYHLLNTMDRDELEANQDVRIDRDYNGRIHSTRVNGMNTNYIPKSTEISYQQDAKIKEIINRIDNVRRSI